MHEMTPLKFGKRTIGITMPPPGLWSDGTLTFKKSESRKGSFEYAK